MSSLRVDHRSATPPSRQIADRLRAMIDRGELRAGARLPSLREAAAQAGVNVNTVRAAYARLERDGVVSTEQGRGTFVTSRQTGESARRRMLQLEIAELEAQLVRLPPPASQHASDARPAVPRLLSVDELAAMRDALAERVRALREARRAITHRIADERRSPPVRAPSSDSSSSLAGARIRWT